MAPKSEVAGHLLSAGLFFATALASQWLQIYMQKQQVEVKSAAEDDCVDENRPQKKAQRNRVRQKREKQRQQSSCSEDDSDAGIVVRQRDQPSCSEDSDACVEDEGYQQDDEPTTSAACNEDKPELEFRDYYSTRRLEDRLSFENLRPLMQESPAESGVSPSQNVTFSQTQTDKTPRQHNKTTSPRKPKPHHRPRRKPRRVGSAVDREEEYDFLPINSNWNHFAMFNEDDVRNGVVVPPASPPRSEYHRHHCFQAFSNGYNVQYANDAGGTIDESDRTETAGEEVSSSESSEEPQFVWTEALHERRHSRVSQRVSGCAPRPATTLPFAPLMAQESTAVMELPHPSPAVRSLTGDSMATIPAANTAVRRGQVSKTLRASTVSPERIDEELTRSTSGHSNMSAASSELSGVSTASIPRHRKQPCKASPGDDLVSSSHRSARAQYNAKIMPNKVVMIRHGQSMGNVNEELYSTTPDNAMPLTKLGFDQARKAGQNLKNNVIAPNESVHFIVSPYARTVETFHGIVSAWCDPEAPEFASIPNREMRLKAWYGRLLEMGLTWHEDPRIREQDFGNYQDPDLIRKAKRDRHRFGTFYYRFPHGESAADVYDRLTSFLDSLWRSFDLNRSRNYVIVSHGISIRLLLARYFRYTIHQFNMLSNPRNCEMVALCHDGQGRLRLLGRYQLHLKERRIEAEAKKKDENNESSPDITFDSNGCPCAPDYTKVWEVDEYKFYKRLSILPQAAIRKVDIRFCYNDGATKEA